MDFGEFRIIGERGFNIERLFNIKRGLTREDDSLPKRLTEELQDPNNPKSKVPLEELKNRFYKSRRWGNDGVPEDRTLRRLKIEHLR